MTDPIKTILNTAVPKVSQTLLENSIFELPATPSSAVKEASKRINALKEKDKTTGDWDRFVRDSGETGFTSRLYQESGDWAVKLDSREKLSSAVKEFTDKYPDQKIPFSEDTFRDLKGIIYKNLLTEHPLFRDSFEASFEKIGQDNPYLSLFTKKTRDNILAKQKIDKDRIGKFKLFPLPTRESVKRTLYDVEKVEDIDEDTPTYMEALDGKLDEHFKYGMTHDMISNWWTETDRFTEMFPADPEFNLSDHYDDFTKATQKYPSPDFAKRLTEAKSYSEFQAIVNAADDVGLYREQATEWFDKEVPLGAGGAAEMGLDMLFGIGLDPVGLAAGIPTGAVGAVAAGKVFAGSTIKAMAGRALIEGAVGGLEGMGYMHLYAKNSDPQRNEADLKQGFLVGGGLGTAFELALGGTARGIVKRGIDKLPINIQGSLGSAKEVIIPNKGWTLSPETLDRGRVGLDDFDEQEAKVNSVGETIRILQGIVGMKEGMLTREEIDAAWAEVRIIREEMGETLDYKLARMSEIAPPLKPMIQWLVDNKMIDFQEERGIMPDGSELVEYYFKDYDIANYEVLWQDAKKGVDVLDILSDDPRRKYEGITKDLDYDQILLVAHQTQKYLPTLSDPPTTPEELKIYKSFLDAIHETIKNPNKEDAFKNVLWILSDLELTRDYDLGKTKEEGFRSAIVVHRALLENLGALRAEGVLKDLSPLAILEMFAEYDISIIEQQDFRKEIRATRRESPLFDVTPLKQEPQLPEAFDIEERVKEAKRVTSLTELDANYDVESLSLLGPSKQAFDFLGAIVENPEAAPILLRALSLLDKNPEMDYREAINKAKRSLEGSGRYTYDQKDAILSKIYDDPEGLTTVYYLLRDDPELIKLEEFKYVRDLFFDQNDIVRSLALFNASLKELEARVQKDKGYISDSLRNKLEKINSTLLVDIERNRNAAAKFVQDHKTTANKIIKHIDLTSDEIKTLKKFFPDLDIDHIRDIVFEQHTPTELSRYNPRPAGDEPLILTPSKEAEVMLRDFHRWKTDNPEYRGAQIANNELRLRRKMVNYMNKIYYEGELLILRRNGLQDTYNEVANKFMNVADPDSPRGKRLQAELQTINRQLDKISQSLDKIQKTTGFDLNDPTTREFLRGALDIHQDFLLQTYTKYKRLLSKGKTRQAQTEQRRLKALQEKNRGKPNAGFIDIGLLFGPAEALVKAIKKLYNKLSGKAAKTERDIKKAQRRKILEKAIEEISRELQDPEIGGDVVQEKLEYLAEYLAEQYDLPENDTYKMLTRLWENRKGNKGKGPVMWAGTNPGDDIFNPLLDRQALFSLDALKRQMQKVEEYINDFYKLNSQILRKEVLDDFDYPGADEGAVANRLVKVIESLKEIERLDVERVLDLEGIPETLRIYEAMGIDIKYGKDGLRYSLYKQYALLAAFSGNILAPTSISQVLSDNLLGTMHNIPHNLIMDLLQDYNQADFQAFLKIYASNHLPFLSDSLFGELRDDSVTFGQLAAYFMKDKTLKDWLEDQSILVVAPHRSVLIELENLSNRLLELQEKAGRELTEVELVAELGPIGPTGLPRDIEKLILPSSEQEAWQRWGAQVKEIVASLVTEDSRETARFLKRKIADFEYLIKESNTILALLPDDPFTKQEVERLKRQKAILEERLEATKDKYADPTKLEVFDELRKVLEVYSKFFDETVETWTQNLESDKNFIEWHVQEISSILEKALIAIEGNPKYADKVVQIKKARNQLNLLAGLPEPHPEHSVDYRRLTFLQGVSLLGEFPALFTKDIEHKYSKLLLMDADGDITISFEILRDLKNFLDDLSESTNRLLPEVDKTSKMSNEELRTLFVDDMDTKALREKLVSMLESGDYPELMQDGWYKKLILDAFDKYADNIIALKDQLKLEGWGNPPLELALSMDPRFEKSFQEKLKRIQTKGKYKKSTAMKATTTLVDRLLKTATKPEDFFPLFLRARLVLDETHLGKILLKVLDMGLDLEGAKEFYNKVEQLNKNRKGNLFDLTREALFEDTWSEDSLRKKAKDLIDGPDEEPPSGGLRGAGSPGFIDLNLLFTPIEKLFKGMKFIWDKLSSMLSRVGSELSFFSKASAQAEFTTKKARSLREWMLSYGNDVMNYAGVSLKVPKIFNRLRSARARAAASDVGIIRRLGELIFGSDLYRPREGGRLKKNVDVSIFQGLLKYKTRILASFKKQLMDLQNEQQIIAKILGVDLNRMKAMYSAVYEAVEFIRQQYQDNREAIPSLRDILLGTPGSDRLVNLFDIFEEVGLEAPKELNSIEKAQKFINLIIKMDDARRKIAKILPQDHPLRRMIEDTINPNILSSDSLLDFDMIIENGGFEKILFESINVARESTDKPISGNAKRVIAFLVAAAIRDGKLNVLTRGNLLDSLRRWDRKVLFVLARKYLDMNRIREIFPQFSEGIFADMSEQEFLNYFANQLFDKRERTTILDDIRGRIKRQLKDLFDIDKILRKRSEGWPGGFEEYKKDYYEAENTPRHKRTAWQNKIIEDVTWDIERLMDRITSKKGVSVLRTKRGDGVRFKIPDDIDDFYFDDDYDLFIEGLEVIIDDFVDDFFGGMSVDELQQYKVVVARETLERIKIDIDAKKEATVKVKEGAKNKEEFKRVKDNTQVGKKIGDSDQVIENVTLEDLVSTADLEDLEHTGTKVVDASTEEKLLSQINKDLAETTEGDAKVSPFESLDEFFDFLEREFRTLVSEGVVKNGPEYTRMLTFMRELTTGRSSKTHSRPMNDFIKLMQKGASALSTAGFGIAALPEAILAVVRNLPRLISKIPYLSQIISGAQKIENFGGQIKDAQQRLKRAIKDFSKTRSEQSLMDIAELEKEIEALEKKQELLQEIIYGAGVGTEGALYRNTGSNRRSAIFDQQNPLTSPAHRPEEFGEKTTGQKLYEKADKFLSETSQRAAEGSILPVLPTGERLLKPLSLNYLTEWTQKVVFNSFVTKFISKVLKLELPFDINDVKAVRSINKETLASILDPILPQTLRDQLGLNDRFLMKIIIGIKLAAVDNPPKKKNGFTHYDIGSLLNHKSIGEQQRQNFIAGLYNWIGQNVARPDAGDLPLYMTSDFLSIVAQFRAFGAGQFQKVVMPLLQRTFAKGNTAKQRVEGAGALAAIAGMSAMYAALQYALYNPEEVKEDMESTGGLKQVAKTGIGDMVNGDFSEDSRNTLSPFAKIIVGGLMEPFTGGIGFGSDIAYSMTGTQDPLSWYEGKGSSGKDQVAADLANSTAAYRFFANTFMDPIKLSKGVMDADTRQEMMDEYNYTPGNAVEKTSAAVGAAGIKPKDQARYLERLSGNYKLFKMIEAMMAFSED